MKDKRFLGATQDNVKRDVNIYADETRMYAVYYEGTSDEHIADVLISAVASDKDNYLFTPYIEFIHMIEN